MPLAVSAALAGFALDTALRAWFRAYNTVLLFGFFGLLAILLTALLSPGVQRNAAWLTFYSTAVLYAVAYLLLFFAGEGLTFEPEPALCLAQAAMTYAVCPLGTCAAMVLSMTMWAGICRPDAYKMAKRISRWGLTAPWVIMMAMLVMSIWIGLADPSGVRMNNEFYCEIDNRVPARTSQILVVLTFAVNLLFQVLTFRGLWLLRAYTTKGDGAHAPVLSVASRMLFWNVSTISMLIIIYVFLSNDANNGHVVSLAQAALPLLAVAAFGTRMDILRAWAPRRQQDGV